MDILKKFAAWFVSGLGLASGALLVFWVYSHFNAPSSSPNIDNPPQMHVSAVSMVPFAKDLVVTGVLANSGPTTYEGSWLEVTLLQDGKVLYRCGDIYHLGIKPGASSPFQVSCSGVARADVPPGSSVSVSVLRADFAPESGT